MGGDEIAIDEHPDPHVVEFLSREISEFNMATTGIRDGRLLSVIVRDEAGRVAAGIYGWTWGGFCEIEYLWVREDRGGRGTGTRLLEAAEREAAARGARQVALSTHSFQAPEFYRRLGYEVVGTLDDYPVGHRLYYLRKGLAS